MKKLASMLLTVLMIMTLVACGQTEQKVDTPPIAEAEPAAADTGTEQASTETSTESEPEKTYKIGVIMYLWTDAQGTNIQNFCNYLEKNMNVEFMFESTFYDDNAQVACVENLISAGCDAIISGYDTNIIAAMDTAKAAGVYYAVALSHITDEDFSGADPGEFFLGGTKQFSGDLAALGEAYADAVLSSGTSVTEIGGISFPAWAFTDAPEIYHGFQSKLIREGKNVSDLAFSSGFSPDEVQGAAQGVINDHKGIEAIFGMSSGLDFVYPILQGTDIKLISMGYDDSVGSLIDNGALIAAGNNNHAQSIASCMARIFNALEGNAYPDAANGEYNIGGIVNGVANYPVIGNAEQLADYQAYVIAEDGVNGSVTIDELKNCIISYNPNATLADLNILTNRSVTEIKAAR